MPTDNTQFYGIGKGSAQVIDTTSGALGQFANLLAKQQAQRQLELKQLADQQAQLKPDGLRNDADRKYFFDQVNDWRTKSIAAQNERDPYKKALAQSGAQKAYMEAQNTVSQSKQQAAKDNAFQTFAMNNTTRHQLTDDAIQKGLANNKLGVNDPNLIDYSSLQRAPNLDAFNKRLKDLNEARLNNAKEDYKLGAVQSIGNTKQTPVTKYKQVKSDDQALDYLNEATVNHDFANVLQNKYPQIYANVQTEDDLHKAHAIASTQLANENPLYKDYGTSFVKNDKPREDVRPTWLQDYWLKHAGVPYDPSKKEGKGETPTYFQDLSERMRTGVTGSGEEFSKYVEANPSYHKGLHFDISGDKTTVTVPAKMKVDKDGERVVDKPSYTVSLDKNDPKQWTAAFASLYKDLTGDATAVPNKAMTEAGKGHVKGGLSPNNKVQTYKVKGKDYKADAVAKAAEASGMTVQEYLKEVNR